MYRQTGAIPQINGVRLPRRLLFFDTEAYRGGFNRGVELQSFRLGVAKYLELDDKLNVRDEAYFHFRDVLSLYEYINVNARKDKTLYVYAHNIKYDLQLSGLFTTMLEDGWKSKVMVLSDPPTFFKLYRHRSSVVFVDTFNYWQFSLARMGQQLGLPKLDIPEDTQSDDDWFTYCRRDADVLSTYVLEFIRYLANNDLAPMGLTIASQAFRAYRHRFMSHEIILHNDEKATVLEREAYSGGRVEAFKIGVCPIQPYYKLDVNSMYPYVMKSYLYPYKLIGYSEGITLSRLKGLLDRYYVIADVSVYTDEAFIPLKYQHKLIFPAHRLQSTLHNPELIYALAHADIQGVHRAAIYEQGDLFTAYVDYFYHMKLQAELENNPLKRQQAKLFLNSLYGKFGKREIISKFIPNPGDPCFQRLIGYSETLQCSVECNYIGSQIELSYKGGESMYSFPAIAGAVTSQARMYLYLLMSKAGLDNVFYVDTDSLIVNLAGYQALSYILDDTKLGAMKLEGVSEHLVINGAKDYQFGDEIKHKGLPKAAIQLTPNSWQYEQFQGVKTWITEGAHTGVKVYQRIKQRKTPYNKGIVNVNGDVTPLLF